MDKLKITLELDVETASALAVLLTSALGKYRRKYQHQDGTLGDFYHDTWLDVTAVRDDLRQHIRRAFQEGSRAS
jgi:hypothetical protein